MPINGKWIRQTKRRFGVQDKVDGRAEFRALRQRVVNALAEVVRFINPDGVREFYQVISEPTRYFETTFDLRPDPRIIPAKLAQAENLEQFLFLLQVVLELPIYGWGELLGFHGDPRAAFLAPIRRAIEMSQIDVELTATDDRAILRPRGEPLLEKPLIEETLGILRGAALGHFTAALASYGKGTNADHVKSAESLRRCLEECLRDRLSNQKGLTANISTLLSKLKEDGRDPAIRNIIHQTFTCLDKYFNENSKHNDGDIDATENEYLLYQVGLLVRYIHRTLKK